MAIVNNQMNSKNKGGENSANQQKQGKVIDPTVAQVKKGQVMQMDKEADAWESINPPPANYYALLPVVSKDGYTENEIVEGDPNSIYYKANLACKIVSSDEAANGSIVYLNVSSYIGRGKKISTMAGVMLKSNKKPSKMPETITHGELLGWFVKWVKAQPTIYAWCDWSAWSSKKQQMVRKGMENFPQSEDGTYDAHLEIDGEEIVGKLKIEKLLTKTEFDEAVQGKSVEEAKGEIPEVEEEEEVKPVTKPAAKQIKNTQATAAPAPPPAKKKVAPAPPPVEEVDMSVGDDEEVVEEEGGGIEDFIDDDDA